MAGPYYCRSTDGNNADDGLTWATAKADLTGVFAVLAAGEIVFMSQAHAQTQATALTLTCPGTPTNPCFIICANDAAEPPTALATTATVSTTGTSGLLINGSFYCYGIIFSAATGTSTADLTLSSSASVSSIQSYESCSFRTGATDTSSRINISVNSTGLTIPHRVLWKNCTVKHAHVSHKIRLKSNFEWNGGGYASGGSVVTNPFFYATNGHGILCYISNVDFTGISASAAMVTGFGAAGLLVFNRCKPPASFSGTLVTSTNRPGSRVEAYNFTLADTNYTLQIEDLGSGTIFDETTLVRTGGASDGTTPISWKMVSSPEAHYPVCVLVAPVIQYWNDNEGSAKTVTVHILHDSATNLTDAEIYVRVNYYGTAGETLGVRVADVKTDFLTAAADQASSSETWTTTGMGNPNKQKLEVTFTPQNKGLFNIEVVLAKPSYTVYVDPKAEIS